MIDTTTHLPVHALPYNFELHDIVLMALGHHPSDQMFARVMDQFECLCAESAECPKIMSIAMHPYLTGVPHRINHARRAFEDVWINFASRAVWHGAAHRGRDRRRPGGAP